MVTTCMLLQWLGSVSTSPSCSMSLSSSSSSRSSFSVEVTGRAPGGTRTAGSCRPGAGGGGLRRTASRRGRRWSWRSYAAVARRTCASVPQLVVVPWRRRKRPVRRRCRKRRSLHLPSSFAAGGCGGGTGGSRQRGGFEVARGGRRRRPNRPHRPTRRREAGTAEARRC